MAVCACLLRKDRRIFKILRGTYRTRLQRIIKLRKCYFFAITIDHLWHVVFPRRLEVASNTANSTMSFKHPSRTRSMRSVSKAAKQYLETNRILVPIRQRRRAQVRHYTKRISCNRLGSPALSTMSRSKPIHSLCCSRLTQRGSWTYQTVSAASNDGDFDSPSSILKWFTMPV